MDDKASNDPLAAKMDALARFSHDISHKVNNPLTYVMNYLFILKNTLKDEDVLSLIEKTEKGVNRVKDILLELVDVSNPVADPKRKIDLRVCIDNDLAGFFSDLMKKGIALVFDLSGSTMVRGSEKSLLQVLINLIENSVEAGATEIAVKAVESADEIYITVEDNGSGVSDEDRDLIFEPFFTTKPAAHGLGLYLTYHIVKALEGRIGYSTGMEGKTAFTVVLPKAIQT